VSTSVSCSAASAMTRECSANVAVIDIIVAFL
jgi:hypothetical protein